MQDIMIRIQTDDFEAWKEQHYLHAASRARYGITDGPAYRDLEDPGAALFLISVQDMDTAMGWFRSDTFKEATRLAKVTGLLASRAEGLGAALTTLICRCEPDIRELLHIPASFAVAGLVTIGYPAEPIPRRLTRNTVEEFTSVDDFDAAPLTGSAEA